MSPAPARAREPGLAIGAIIAVAFTAVAAFVVLWFPEREMRSARAALQHKVDNQAALVAYTIAPAIDFDDLDMVDEVVSGLAQDGDFVAVEVRSVDGALVRARGETHAGEPVVEAEIPIRSRERALGTLHLTMSEARIRAENQTQLVAASGIALTIVLLGVVVAWMVAQAVRRVASLTAQNASSLAAKERAEARSRFMSVLSHEVRTPLNGVLGIADALARRPLDPESRSLAASLLRSGQNLLELINDVLDSAKLESGRVEVERAPFDPEAAALRVVETLTAPARAKKLELVLDTSADVPRSVVGDRHRVQQVLTNLVGNAIKFTETGHVCVRLGWRAPSTLTVAVIDTGMGIPEDKHAVVFEPFSQADASTTRRFGGTGLGLTISRDLVRLMGGELRLESAVGRGTTFSFEVAAPTADADAEPPSVASAPRWSEAWITSGTAVWAEILARRCSERGLRAEVIEEKDAIARLVSLDVPVVLVRDAALGLGSPELERALRDARRRTGSRVLGLASAFETAALAHLADATLPKPFSRADFGAALRAVDADVPAATSPGAPDVALRSDARVLVADDDGVNRIVMKLLLDGVGGVIELVGDGREALARTQRSPPIDLLLVDGEMPELDGYETVRRIRAQEADAGDRRMVILMVSAHAREQLWPRAQSAGADGYLAKPVTMAALGTVLREHAAALLESRPHHTGASEAPGGEALRAAFEESTSQSVAALGETIRNRDLEGAARHAHKLKGTCLVFGAVAAADAALALEQALERGEQAEIVERMFALEIALHEVAA